MRGTFDKMEIIPFADRYEPVQVFAYSNEHPQQVLYLRRPKGKKNIPLVLFFHGGGMTQDLRECPDCFYQGEYAVIEARYRLADVAKTPAQAEDAAKAIAYCLANADTMGIDRSKVFVGGMSAGAYLAAITVMAPRFLAQYGFSHNDIAGLILLSGQMTTHFRFKADMGDTRGQFAPDYGEYAPMAHLSKDLPPMLLVTGEPGFDILARPEENAFVAATLKALGHPFVRCYSLKGHNHGMVLDGGNELICQFIKAVLQDKQ